MKLIEKRKIFLPPVGNVYADTLISRNARQTKKLDSILRKRGYLLYRTISPLKFVYAMYGDMQHPACITEYIVLQVI